MNTTAHLSFKTIAPNKALTQACDALIVGVYAQPAAKAGAKKAAKSPQAAYALPANTQAALDALNLSGAALADLPTGAGKTHTLYVPEGCAIQAARIICVGLGEAAACDAKTYAKALRAALNDCANAPVKSVVNGLQGLDVPSMDAAGQARMAASLAHEVSYRYDATLSKKANLPTLATIYLPSADAKAADLGASQGNAIGQGANLTRELANLPANICTPKYLAQQAQALAKEFNLGCEVLERKQLQALKMGSFLSVAAGSDEPPRLIVLKYEGGKKGAAPQVLVGKGVTFDTGGISLKPGEGMDEMKYDMCGAASVLGTLRAAAQMQLKINLIGIIVATENMPNGHATKPGDVVTAMNGTTIEVLNTDAEGRLILCDALTYAERFNPVAVVDIATLTGACVIALGAVHSGLFGNNDALVGKLLQAGKTALDPAWHMPLGGDYQDQLKSNFADLANIGGRPAGSVTAATFLNHFTKNYPWAHLDIAGTAWKSGAAKGATARPVGLLAQYLIDAAA